MSQPEKPVVVDGLTVCEDDSEVSNSTDGKVRADCKGSIVLFADCRSSDSAHLSAGEDNLSENDEKQPQVVQKSVEECLTTIENLEKTCREFHQKCKQQQSNLDMVSRQYAIALKEKELMVMRYAVGEKTVLDLKSSKEIAEKKFKEACRENELLQHKVSVMGSEKSRICQMLDDKVHELKCCLQDVEKQKLDLLALETKLKWSQNALKAEKDLRKESDSKVEVLRLKVQEHCSEAEIAKRDAQESIKNFHHSQDNRAYVLDQQLKHEQAALILLRHEKEDQDRQLKCLQTELQSLQVREKDATDEKNAILSKLEDLEKNHKEVILRVTGLEKSEVELQEKNVELRELKPQLQQEQKEKTEFCNQLESLKQRNAEVEADLTACRERETELLSFTQQLTNKNVQLLSEFTAMETKVHQLKCEHDLLKKTATDSEIKVDLLTKQLVNDRYKFAADNADLLKKLETKTKMCENLLQEVSDQQGENCIIKRKYELSLKEVNKELQQCRKKMDQQDTASRSSNSSDCSLNGSEPVTILGNSYSDGDQVKVIQPEMTLDKKALVEHIVKLQRVSARKSEKIDFLEEHIHTLVAELQKKTRLLQDYIIREETGALTSNKMDKNKANIAKLNGVMASVYSSRVADNNLTLELSLDINRKLQAVLEDALLKNITLKENIDTLGAEIDRLNNLIKSSYTNVVNT